mgnify:CR=1 FL=1
MPVLQKILFEDALNEKGIRIKNIQIDIKNGKCYNDNIEYPIIFPEKYLTKINKLDKTKTIDYNFKGRYMECREWIKKFRNIYFTEDGQKLETNEYYFDESYYKLLCNSKFTLCPAGCCCVNTSFSKEEDRTCKNPKTCCLWSYRFFEACMCDSIPIIENLESIHESMHGFKFYFSNEEHIYRQDWVDRNRELFIERHILCL